jgi:hypothetical protein
LLYVRLHVLQGLVAYLMGNKDEAKFYLTKADSESKSLVPNPDHIENLIQMGFNEKDARFALKATQNEFDDAISYMIQKREEERARKERDEQRRRDRREQVRIGKTSDGKAFINIEHVRQLEPMVRNDYEDYAWTKELIIEALRKTNNNVESSVQLLTGQRDTLEYAAEMQTHQRRAREKHVMNLMGMGFDLELATFALKLFDNNVEQACTALLEGKVPHPKISYEQPSHWRDLTPTPTSTSDTLNANVFDLPQQEAQPQLTEQITDVLDQVPPNNNLDIEQLDREFLQEQERIQNELNEIEDTIDSELVDAIRTDEDELYDSDLVDERALLLEYTQKLEQ